MAKKRTGNHYGQPLTVSVRDGKLTIEIGVNTLAHAVSYSDWANEWDDKRQDYIRTFAITDAEAFAGEVEHAMLSEREDGSTPLSDFLDKMTEAAIEDGSMAVDYDVRIKHGGTAAQETWANSIK